MTIPDVFIIESLSKIDEAEHRSDGQRLFDILRLSGKNPRYFYFQSKEELPHILELYKQSKYRFLHVSCHGSAQHVFTTTDRLSYPEFSEIFDGFLKLRRVFFSSCELGNELFSTCLAARNKGMHSIVAPAEPIDFSHAAAIWSAFYISAFANNAGNMTRIDMENRISTLCTLFPVEFHLSTYHPKFDSWQHRRINKSHHGETLGPTKSIDEDVESA